MKINNNEIFHTEDTQIPIFSPQEKASQEIILVRCIENYIIYIIVLAQKIQTLLNTLEADANSAVNKETQTKSLEDIELKNSIEILIGKIMETLNEAKRYQLNTIIIIVNRLIFELETMKNQLPSQE